MRMRMRMGVLWTRQDDSSSSLPVAHLAAMMGRTRRQGLADVSRKW